MARFGQASIPLKVCLFSEDDKFCAVPVGGVGGSCVITLDPSPAAPISHVCQPPAEEQDATPTEDLNSGRPPSDVHIRTRLKCPVVRVLPEGIRGAQMPERRMDRDEFWCSNLFAERGRMRNGLVTSACSRSFSTSKRITVA